MCNDSKRWCNDLQPIGVITTRECDAAPRARDPCGCAGMNDRFETPPEHPPRPRPAAALAPPLAPKRQEPAPSQAQAAHEAAREARRQKIRHNYTWYIKNITHSRVYVLPQPAAVSGLSYSLAPAAQQARSPASLEPGAERATCPFLPPCCRRIAARVPVCGGGVARCGGAQQLHARARAAVPLRPSALRLPPSASRRRSTPLPQPLPLCSARGRLTAACSAAACRRSLRQSASGVEEAEGDGGEEGGDRVALLRARRQR